jgi:hypothetical protein
MLLQHHQLLLQAVSDIVLKATSNLLIVPLVFSSKM